MRARVMFSQHVMDTNTFPASFWLTEPTWSDGLLWGTDENGARTAIPFTAMQWFEIEP